MSRRSVILGLCAAGAIVAIGLVGATLRQSAHPVAPASVMDRATFDATIENLVRHDPPSSDGMWHNPQLIALAGMGEQSVLFAVEFLACGCRSPAEAGVLVRAMYLLPLPAYLDFLRQIKSAYDRHLVSADTVALAVQIPDGFSTDLQRHYKDPAVKAVLGAIAASADLPQSTKYSIGDLISGRTWSQTRAFCRDRVFETTADCRTLSFLDLL